MMSNCAENKDLDLGDLVRLSQPAAEVALVSARCDVIKDDKVVSVPSDTIYILPTVHRPSASVLVWYCTVDSLLSIRVGRKEVYGATGHSEMPANTSIN